MATGCLACKLARFCLALAGRTIASGQPRSDPPKGLWDPELSVGGSSQPRAHPPCLSNLVAGRKWT